MYRDKQDRAAEKRVTQAFLVVFMSALAGSLITVLKQWSDWKFTIAITIGLTLSIACLALMLRASQALDVTHSLEDIHEHPAARKAAFVLLGSFVWMVLTMALAILGFME